jgi:hypothetical protein
MEKAGISISYNPLVEKDCNKWNIHSNANSSTRRLPWEFPFRVARQAGGTIHARPRSLGPHTTTHTARNLPSVFNGQHACPARRQFKDSAHIGGRFWKIDNSGGKPESAVTDFFSAADDFLNTACTTTTTLLTTDPHELGLLFLYLSSYMSTTTTMQ